MTCIWGVHRVDLNSTEYICQRMDNCVTMISCIKNDQLQ